MGEQRPDVHIIWITPRFPLGTPDGARHATRSLMHHLAQRHIGIDLICLLPSGETADSAAARDQLNLLSCSIIFRSRSLFWRLPSLKTPLTFRTFASPHVRMAFKEKLGSLLSASGPSQNIVLVFEGLHTFAALSASDLQALCGPFRRIVHRAHNFEATLWDQCAEKARTPWFRWFFRYQAALVRTFERRMARYVNLIVPVSEDDAAKFKDLVPGAAISVAPIGMDFPDEKALRPLRDSETFELLFIGRLDWLPNRKGLMWFLENVWPRLIVKRPQATLKIAGVGDGRWLEPFRTLSGIECLGKVDDIRPLYDSSILAIAPLFQGSGTRVKIIEAACYGRAVLTTALGAEGTGLIPGSSYVRAETQEEWLSSLVTITKVDCQRVGGAAFRSLRERFDGKRIAEQLAQTLSSLPAQTAQGPF